MPITTIPYSEQLGFSKLFRDFIEGSAAVMRYFPAGDFASIARRLHSTPYDREAIASLLVRQNRGWNASAAVFDSIEKIRDKNAVAVFTGQQACLFGGPYMILLKAMAAVKCAEKLERDLSVPVVPIFWIAADDHDVPEVATVGLFDTRGKINRFEIDHDAQVPSPPVGAMRYDASIRREVERLKAIFPDNDFKQVTMTPLDEIYQTGERIVDCFARYLLSVMGWFGLVMFSPYEEEFKAAAAPFLARIVDGHAAIRDVLAVTGSELEQSGYHLQVRKAETAVHLFIHNPDRNAIHRDGDRFVAGSANFSATELQDAIASRPLDFSPDVFTRPLVQSHFFPAAAIIGGPAEVAYYAQMMPLFDVFDLITPQILARPSATILETRYEKMMHDQGLTLNDFAGDYEARINDILAQTFPERFDSMLSDYRENVMHGISELRTELHACDANLSGVVDHTRKKVDYLLQDLRKRILAAHKKRNKVERDRLLRLRDHLFPDNRLAERSIAPAYFLSRYGPNIVDFIFENIQLSETGHQVLSLSDYNG